MSRKSKSKDQTKALNIPFSLTQGDLVQEALAKNKLTPYLVGIVSVSQNIRSTLLLPFHPVSYVYIPPPRGTLTGIFNA
jgi:hypothetical protein